MFLNYTYVHIIPKYNNTRSLYKLYIMIKPVDLYDNVARRHYSQKYYSMKADRSSNIMVLTFIVQ